MNVEQAQALAAQLDDEANDLAALAHSPLPRINPETEHALVYALLAVERRLAWLGAVLAPSWTRLDSGAPPGPVGQHGPGTGPSAYGSAP